MHFLIVGTGRCGSTLLQHILNSHPEVFVYPETHWLPKMTEWFGDRQTCPQELLKVIDRTQHVTGKPTTEIPEMVRSEIQKHTEPLSVKQFCDYLGNNIASSLNKTVWADKTPDYGYFINNIRILWPDCRVIHIFRDPLFVVKSMQFQLR